MVGKQRYSCPRSIARLLSRTICVQHSIDASIKEYVVETKDPEDQFPLFHLFGLGGTIQISKETRPFLFSLSRELNNSDIFCSFLGNRLTSGELIYSLSDDDAIPFIASEFYRLDDSQLDQIPLSVLYHILSRPSRTISSDSALYSYISSRHSANPEYLP
jgi:hypothetical protein